MMAGRAGEDVVAAPAQVKHQKKKPQQRKRKHQASSKADSAHSQGAVTAKKARPGAPAAADKEATSKQAPSYKEQQQQAAAKQQPQLSVPDSFLLIDEDNDNSADAGSSGTRAATVSTGGTTTAAAAAAAAGSEALPCGLTEADVTSLYHGCTTLEEATQRLLHARPLKAGGAAEQDQPATRHMPAARHLQPLLQGSLVPQLRRLQLTACPFIPSRTSRSRTSQLIQSLAADSTFTAAFSEVYCIVAAGPEQWPQQAAADDSDVPPLDARFRSAVEALAPCMARWAQLLLVPNLHVDVPAGDGDGRGLALVLSGLRLGSGAFGSVFQGWCVTSRRPVAVKVLEAAVYASKHNIRGAHFEHYLMATEIGCQQRVAAAGSHPNIVPMLGWARQRGGPAFPSGPCGDRYQDAFLVVQALVPHARPTLPLRLAPGKPDEALALDYGRQVLSALHFLHSLSPPVLHRDLKYANLLVNGQGAMLLTDFGVSKVQGERAMNVVKRDDSHGVGTRGVPGGGGCRPARRRRPRQTSGPGRC